MLRSLLPPMMLCSSRTVFSVFCNLSSKTAIFSAMFVSFSPNAPNFWSKLIEPQQVSSPEHESTFPSFSTTCASQRHKQNTSETTIFFIAFSKCQPLFDLLLYTVYLVLGKTGKKQDTPTITFNFQWNLPVDWFSPRTLTDRCCCVQIVIFFSTSRNTQHVLT